MLKSIYDFIMWLDWPAIICCTPLVVMAKKEGLW